VKLDQNVNNIQSREDLVSFIKALRHDLKQAPDSWTNADLDSFLEAMAAWIEVMDGYYRNLGEPMPEQPTWSTIGQILIAAKMYE
jgi:hypothetical protein